MLSNRTDGFYILDKNLIITALNAVEAERQGCNPNELIGKSYLSFGWIDNTSELLEKIKETLQTGKETGWLPTENEAEPYLQDKEFYIYPLLCGQNKQVIVLAQDISERRQWQASLLYSANLAIVGQLVGNIAHQINNPLTVAMANSQLLLLETTADDELHQLATDIFTASKSIQNIVENLLGFSNQERYFFVKVNLIDTIEGALSLVTSSLKKTNIRLIKDYQIQPILSASESHLKLVWLNLLLNARDAVVDYTKEPQITITVGAVSEREIKIAVSDNGCGIKKKDMKQLFRPFFSTKPASKSTGLGLYSTHTIIERHNGQINLYSKPGEPTTFEILLPLDNQLAS